MKKSLPFFTLFLIALAFMSISSHISRAEREPLYCRIWTEQSTYHVGDIATIYFEVEYTTVWGHGMIWVGITESWEGGSRSIFDRIVSPGTYWINVEIKEPTGTHSFRIVAMEYADDVSFYGVDFCSIQVYPPRLPDLTVGNIYWSPSGPSEGDEIQFSIEICNEGDEDAGMFEVVTFVDDQEIDRRRISGLRIDETYTFNVKWMAPMGSAGDHTVKVIVDPENTIEESWEGGEDNNEEIKSFHVYLSRPDLIITNVESKRNVFRKGAKLTLTVDIKNMGNADADKFHIVLYINGSKVYDEIVDGLLIDELKTITINYRLANLEEGTYEAEIRVDPYDEIVEKGVFKPRFF